MDPEYKRRGIGKALFRASVEWCREEGLKMLKIETQNVNVPACRFYASQGARLGAINRYAYADATWSRPDVQMRSCCCGIIASSGELLKVTYDRIIIDL